MIMDDTIKYLYRTILRFGKTKISKEVDGRRFIFSGNFPDYGITVVIDTENGIIRWANILDHVALHYMIKQSFEDDMLSDLSASLDTLGL